MGGQDYSTGTVEGRIWAVERQAFRRVITAVSVSFVAAHILYPGLNSPLHLGPILSIHQRGCFVNGLLPPFPNYIRPTSLRRREWGAPTGARRGRLLAYSVVRFLAYYVAPGSTPGARNVNGAGGPNGTIYLQVGTLMGPIRPPIFTREAKVAPL